MDIATKDARIPKANSVPLTANLVSYYLANKRSLHVRYQGLEIPTLILLSYYLANKQSLHVRSQGLEILTLIEGNKRD